jgi:hypothetical protein
VNATRFSQLEHVSSDLQLNDSLCRFYCFDLERLNDPIGREGFTRGFSLDEPLPLLKNAI